MPHFSKEPWGCQSYWPPYVRHLWPEFQGFWLITAFKGHGSCICLAPRMTCHFTNLDVCFHRPFILSFCAEIPNKDGTCVTEICSLLGCSTYFSHLMFSIYNKSGQIWTTNWIMKGSIYCYYVSTTQFTIFQNSCPGWWNRYTLFAFKVEMLNAEGLDLSDNSNSSSILIIW